MASREGGSGGGLSKASANQAPVDYQAEAFLEGMEDWERERESVLIAWQIFFSAPRFFGSLSSS